MAQLPGWLLLACSDAEAAGILVVRHEIAVLCRKAARLTPQWADRDTGLTGETI